MSTESITIDELLSENRVLRGADRRLLDVRIYARQRLRALGEHPPRDYAARAAWRAERRAVECILRRAT